MEGMLACKYVLIDFYEMFYYARIPKTATQNHVILMHDDLNIKCKDQKVVRNRSGNLYLSTIFFPQIKQICYR